MASQVENTLLNPLRSALTAWMGEISDSKLSRLYSILNATMKIPKLGSMHDVMPLVLERVGLSKAEILVPHRVAQTLVAHSQIALREIDLSLDPVCSRILLASFGHVCHLSARSLI